jgi:hypothetical protein
MSRRLPESWVLLVDGEPTVDESTGNRIPAVPVEVPWTGLLQQRQLASSSVDSGNTEFTDGHVTSSYMLLLDPGLDPFPSARDRFRDSDGIVYQVVGKPRVRRPARGSRKPNYIAAIVRAASDVKEGA